MTLDWMKSPKIQEMVSAQHSDFQMTRAVDWLSSYDGTDVFKDFLSEVPFDITDENREDYWDIVFNLTPMSKEEAENAYINAKMEEVDAAPTAMDKSFLLLELQSTGNDRISQEFKERSDAVNGYMTAESLFNSQVTFKADTGKRVAEILGNTEESLDAFVPTKDHMHSILELVRYDKLDGAFIHNGLVSYKDNDGNIIPGKNAGIGLDDAELPSGQEQLEVMRLAHEAIKPHVNTKLEMSRAEYVAAKAVADETLYNYGTEGNLSTNDAVPALMARLKAPDHDIEKHTGKMIGGVIKNTLPNHINKDASRFIAKFINASAKRGSL
jgi:hypothetical protein